MQSEVNILHDCAKLKINNVVKIKDCSFDGTMVKEVSPDQSSSDNSDRVCRQLQRLELSDSDDSVIIKRKHPVCFYVMSFAKQGELYRLVEMNDSLSDNLIRYLFLQLLQGLH